MIIRPGDCFVCTTVEEMLPEITYEPADYSPARRRLLENPSTQQDIVDFIVDYILSDVSLYIKSRIGIKMLTLLA